MGSYSCLSFLTDYGLQDGFVAACHGVAARLAPDVRVIDVTHLVPQGEIRRAAAVLAQTVPYFPPAVHVAVVDPGVGTSRRAVALEAGDSLFVAPDNGLLSWAADALGGVRRAHDITNSDLFVHPVSRTFHGRDIFMPAGARLAAGLELADVGPAVPPDQLTYLPTPRSRLADGYAWGEVVSVDRFGNIQLSLTAEQLGRLGIRVGAGLVLKVASGTYRVSYRDTFGSVTRGELVAYTDSAGLVAVAVNGGDAAGRLGLPPGTGVCVAAVDPRARVGPLPGGFPSG
ncbi:MAG: SAM hydrolase/SAM-dependent halogenase family protein [Streptosporangiaceae bacterium]